MRLDQPISYNGITTGLTTRAGGLPDVGVEITRVRYGDVQADAYLDKRALQDGLDASDVYLSGRQVLIDAAVYGSTEGDLWDRVQDFNHAFNPHIAYDADTAEVGFLPFKFYQATADIASWPSASYPSGIPLQMYLRPLRTPSFVIEKANTGGGGFVGQGAKQLLTVPLIARDPRKYVQTAISSSITTAVKATSYRGDYPSLPIITFSVTATGHSAFTMTIGGKSIVIDLAAVSTGSFTLDFADHTLIDGDGDSRASLMDFAEFATIEFGTTFVLANAQGVSNPTLTYYEAFS